MGHRGVLMLIWLAWKRQFKIRGSVHEVRDEHEQNEIFTYNS